MNGTCNSFEITFDCIVLLVLSTSIKSRHYYGYVYVLYVVRQVNVFLSFALPLVYVLYFVRYVSRTEAIFM